MSLITGCPACGTMFRVVPDQLKISEGWVRCGHCSEVFDATAHLQDASSLAPLEPPGSAAGGAEAEAETASEPGDPQETASPQAEPGNAAFADEPLPQPAEAGLEEPASSSEETDGDLAPAVEVSQGQDAPDGVAAVDHDAQPVVADEAAPADAFRRESRDEVLPVPLPTAGIVEPALEDVSFVRDARRKAFWRRPAVRAVLLLVALVLALLLAVQAAVHERDRLALAYPALRPWLEQLCGPLQCRIAPPRRIEALAIDSSGFTKLRSDGYRLSFTLKNNAAHPVAVPALELTLTDSQDQPVLRRVLLPREFGAAAETLPGGGDWSAAVSLAVDGAPNAGSRIAGYRLLAFYP